MAIRMCPVALFAKTKSYDYNRKKIVSAIYSTKCNHALNKNENLNDYVYIYILSITYSGILSEE
jgi:hypothetical protein